MEWQSSPARYNTLCTLLDMLQFKADDFFWLTSMIQQLRNDYAGTGSITKKDHSTLTESLAITSTYANELKLVFATKHIARMIDALNQPDCQYTHVRPLVDELQRRISDELEENVFFHVSREKAPYHQAPLSQFGQEIIDKFPSIQRDVEDAGRAYGLGLNTACAFHLMRIMEVGLHSLSKSLNDDGLDARRNPNWGIILSRCEKELAKPWDQRSLEWRQDAAFFANAIANLRAVKEAWRNPTMHVEIHYDESEALEVYGAVRGFMRHLSTKLCG